MKEKTWFLIILLSFIFPPSILNAQGNYTDVVYLKNGNIIRGFIIEQIPNQSLKIQTKENNIFVCKMDEIEKITKEEVSGVKKNDTVRYKKYTESYFFGGFSSKKSILQMQFTDDYGNPMIIDMIYKNGGLGGVGTSWMAIGRNNRPDVMLDCEVSFYGVKMTADLNNQSVELMSGFAMCFDFDCTIFPVKARNSYPSPFVFAGAGARLVSMTSKGDNSKASEYHGELPFGIGLRQKISKTVAFQIRERFVWSKLKDVDMFILPETRFELIISAGKDDHFYMTKYKRAEDCFFDYKKFTLKT